MVQFRAYGGHALMAIQLPTRRGELLAGVAVTGWGRAAVRAGAAFSPF